MQFLVMGNGLQPLSRSSIADWQSGTCKRCALKLSTSCFVCHYNLTNGSNTTTDCFGGSVADMSVNVLYPSELLIYCRTYYHTQVNRSMQLIRYHFILLTQTCCAHLVLMGYRSGISTSLEVRMRCAMCLYRCQVSHCKLAVLEDLTYNTVQF